GVTSGVGNQLRNTGRDVQLSVMDLGRPGWSHVLAVNVVGSATFAVRSGACFSWLDPVGCGMCRSDRGRAGDRSARLRMADNTRCRAQRDRTTVAAVGAPDLRCVINAHQHDRFTLVLYSGLEL